MPQGQLTDDLAQAVDARLGAWAESDAVERLKRADHSLWVSEPGPDIQDRVGWLDLPISTDVAEIEAFAAQVIDGVDRVVLLGMGGSSLAPETFARTLSSQGPGLIVLDSTHPRAIASVESVIDPARTLFVVASKSGTTIESLSFMRYFWHRLDDLGIEPGPRFVAISDPGSPLVDMATDRGFLRVFEADPDVGGRYSALGHFGLVPAALAGIDASALRAEAAAARSSALEDPASQAFRLGAILGEAALSGRDKATWVTSPGLEAFPSWVEQLVAESTGKQGVGIVPVAGETLGPPEEYGDDRLFIALTLEDDPPLPALEVLEAAGLTVVHRTIASPDAVAAEMYRNEVAVAMAGSVLGINPFDQPDVQLAKEMARSAMQGDLESSDITERYPEEGEPFGAAIRGFVESAEAGDYVAIQAFIPQTAATTAALQSLRHAVRRRGIATTLGYGPRFLHSTGQLHKGGPDGGLFLQIVDHGGEDLPVPETDFTFGRLVGAQADGDYAALEARGRRILRVCLGDDIPDGLAALREAVR